MDEPLLKEISDLSNKELTTDIDSLVLRTSMAIENNAIGIHHVVQSLESSLTNRNPLERASGTGFLANILTQLAKSCLDEKQIDFLVTFFVDRLKDHHSIIPKVIIAFNALVSYEQISDESVQLCLQGLFINVQCQSQVMTDRRNIFNLFKYCLTNKLPVLKKMGQDFTYGFLTSMDGERDPRNLVLLFSLASIVVVNISLGPFTEEMFEVVAAYFPIDFVPPSNDPFGISMDDLIVGLRTCLSCSYHFAPFCLPLLQEKLDSDINSAKLDSLHTLVACCNNYRSLDINTHMLTLYESIKREVIENVNNDIEGAALSALTALLEALEREPLSQNIRKSNDQIIASALDESIEHLSTPEQRLMYPSSRLLLAFCASSPRVARIVALKVLPLLCDQYNLKSDEKPRKTLLLILSKFLKCLSNHPHFFKDETLLEIKETCCDLFISCIGGGSTVIQEAALTAIIPIINLFDETQHTQLAHLLNQLLTENDTVVCLRDEAINCVNSLGVDYPQITENYILHPMLKSDTEDNISIEENDRRDVVLSSLSINIDTVAEILPTLIELTNSNLLTNIQKATCWLQCIDDILCKMKIPNDPSSTSIASISTSLLAKLTHWCIMSTIGHDYPDDLRYQFLSSASSCCRTVLKMKHKASIDKALHLTKQITSLYLNADLETIIDHPLEEVIISNMDILYEKKKYLVYFLEGLILSLPRDVMLDDVDSVIKALMDVIKRGDRRLCEISAITIATIVNKHPQNNKLKSICHDLYKKFSCIISSKEEDIDKDMKQKHLMTYAYITKALVVRGEPHAQLFVDFLHDLLSDKELGQYAATAFQLIMMDHEYALQPSTYAIVRLLYRQRFFENNLANLTNPFEEEDTVTKHNALLALTAMLPYVPSQVLRNHIRKLLPFLMQGLKIENDAITAETVNTLSKLLDHSCHDAILHVGTLVPLLINLSVGKPLKVRMKSCDCLNHLTRLDTPVILPYRQEVINGLKKPLNDRKRVVRSVAAKARSSWVLVGAP